MRKSLFIGLTAVLGLIGCSRNQEIDVPDANLSIFARTESPSETKTVVEEGVHVYWEPGDEIAVFMGEQSAKFTTDITTASGTATFKGTFGEATWPEDLDLWAVYPFSEDAVFDGETITTTLPSEQVAREGSFGKDMNLAIAHSNSSTLQFYNVGGGIRFSVTEEGIKKVMFEGLSGEIISGKVKIGFENGLPVVKEVTGGSQFITLLPPTGQETFEPGVWYYIVALPGSLEGGYKLRFYKDSDYARKVSEKAVQIKRSIFGNVEKADDGIDFEPQTTHFPETDDEIVSSVELTESIHKVVHSILWEDNYTDDREVEDLVEDIRKIEGVIFAQQNEDNTAIVVIQKDSICVNYMLESYSSVLDLSYQDECGNSMWIQKKMVSPKRIVQNKKEGKKALILAPFQEEFKKNIESIWIPRLTDNYQDRIQYLPGDMAGFLQFKEELNSQYDLIMIDTHGTTGFCTTTAHFLWYTTAPTWDSYLSTSTMYSAKVLKSLIDNEGVLLKETGLITPPKSQHEYLGISTKILDNASFDASCVIITACESAKSLFGNKPWLDAFRSKGALVVSGAKVSMGSSVLGPTADKLIQMMTLGCSFREAFNYVTQSSMMSHWTKAVYEHQKKDDKKLKYEEFDIANQFIYAQNATNTSRFFLTDPLPVLNEPEPDADSSNSIVLSWESYPISFPLRIAWRYSVDESTNKPIDEYRTYSRFYDVYVDGVQVDIDCFESEDNSKQKIFYPKPSTGTHSWRVVTNIKEVESGDIIASYPSDEVRFIMTDYVAVESVSLDKTNYDLTIGNTVTLTATILPENATNKSVTWSSSDESVATVTPQGVVTAISAGPVVISVTTSDGGKTANCNVTVKKTSVGGDIEGTERDPWN